ncbi:hypothetical protein [Microbispora sp. NPDC046933]|uniref:effector-associated constant component EACC1 n=1 Tax=Microbispora sp. NPDC046933 TaxID=3155618 RepID=UPI0033CF8377
MVVTIAAEDRAEQILDLYSWLSDEPELRGHVHIREAAALPGALGPVADGLQVALGAGGAVASLASVVIAWLRTRGGEIGVTLSRSEDETRVEVTAKGVKALDLAGTQALTAHLVQALRDTRSDDDG